MGWEVGVGDDRGLTHVRQAWGANFEARFPCPPPLPPLPPFRFRFHPQQDGRPGKEPRWVPTDLPCGRVFGESLFACVGAAAGKEQAKVTIAICHLLPLSMDACANRPVAARVPLWEPTLSPSPSPNPHLIARNMGDQGSGTV